MLLLFFVCRDKSQGRNRFKVSHLFIDEASQGSEPSVLIPVTGLLMSTGQLILAGDPQQLGPVCVSKQASSLGLGNSYSYVILCGSKHRS